MTECSSNFSFENRFKIMFGSDEFKTLDRNIIDITIPSITIGTIQQPTPIKDVFIPGDSLDIGEINMTFLLDEDYNNYKTILDWMNTIRDFRNISLDRYVIDITINLLCAKYKSIFEINCEDCFPFNISDIFLNHQTVSPEPVRFLTTFKVNNIQWN